MALLLATIVLLTRAGGAEFTVASTGDDRGPGSREHPFATLEAARAAVRQLTEGGSLPAGGVTIYLRAGTWLREKSFTLEARDSGSEAAPITYCAWGDEHPCVVGARLLAPTSFAPVTDARIRARLPESARAAVVQLDLRALGIVHAGPPADLYQGTGGLLRLFVDGHPLGQARWPKDGYVTMASVRDGGSTGSSAHGGTFIYRGDHPAAWLPSLDSGIWVVGFWRVPWVVQAVRVRSINAADHAIEQAAPVPGGIGSKYSESRNGTRQGDGKEPWYVCNVLEELSQPGEWCIDFPSKTLYLWPPQPIDRCRIMCADSDEPIIHLQGASHVVLRGLTVLGGLGDGIRIDGGGDDVIAGCQLRETGAAGVRISGGRSHIIRSCDVVDAGAQGIILDAGERSSLSRGDCLVQNNHIHHYGRCDPMVSAIDISGVGNRVASNLIHDGPYGGVLYHGNDQLMELNEVHNIGLDGGDLGAFYANADWASRGNVMRANLVHHAPNANAFYMDDGHCGDEIVGNLVYHAGCGPFIGGGHDHLVHGNVVMDCPKAIHLDDRGVARNYDLTSRIHAGPLANVPWKSSLWSSHYPQLAQMFAEDLLPLPTGNRITGNAFIACVRIDLSGKPEHLRHSQISGNLILASDPGFIDAAHLDFHLAAGASWPDRLGGVPAIPWDRIGLYIDEDRRTLPSAAETQRLEDRPPRRTFDSDVDVERSNRR